MSNPSAWDIELEQLDYKSWRDALAGIGAQTGFFEPLGPAHHALFEDSGNTLLVSFETFPAIGALMTDIRPVGYQVAQVLGWSLLSVVARRDTWFRDPAVYEFFDRLTDDGFFDEFDRIVFFGAGPCGYAASAFSVAAPGSTIVALQPQATLDPEMTVWDDRFTELRRVDFNDRYGYAPDMVEAAERAFIFYDPHEPLDAMHAALFRGPNVTALRAPFTNGSLLTALLQMEILTPILQGAAEGTLGRLSFAKLFRARRDYGPYLRRLLVKVEEEERLELVRYLCANVANRKTAPRFRRRLRALRRLDEQEASLAAIEDEIDLGDDAEDGDDTRTAAQ